MRTAQEKTGKPATRRAVESVGKETWKLHFPSGQKHSLKRHLLS